MSLPTLPTIPQPWPAVLGIVALGVIIAAVIHLNNKRKNKGG